ncbi:hypothetical protein Gotur_015450 [Gossypium turneri]
MRYSFGSDFIKRRDFIRKEAEETWSVSRLIGMTIEVDDNLVMKELVGLRWKILIIWTDSNHWCDCGALKDCYPRIFALAMDIVAKAKDYSQNGKFYHQLWSSFFQRNHFYLGVEVMEQFASIPTMSFLKNRGISISDEHVVSHWRKLESKD